MTIYIVSYTSYYAACGRNVYNEQKIFSSLREANEELSALRKKAKESLVYNCDVPKKWIRSTREKNGSRIYVNDCEINDEEQYGQILVQITSHEI